MRLQTIAILSLTLAGFALRLYYLTTSHPFFDEYTTVLAARQILQYGWPVLPSGLFYEHGLLATYLIAPFTALFINLPVDQWQPAHWGLMLARWPSALIGTLTIPLIYAIGRKINGQWSIFNNQLSMVNPLSSIFYLPSSTSLLAAGLFALSPEGMVWGGRARMYALATYLVLLTVFWAYRGAVYPAPARFRWLALVALLAALLTQFGALVLIPALVVGMIVVGWLSHNQAEVQEDKRITPHASRVWFLQIPVILEALTLGGIIIVAIWVKRLGQPVGMAALGSDEGGALAAKLIETITYQTAFSLNWADTREFLAEQFGPSHLFWLTLVTVIGTVIGMVIYLANKGRISEGCKYCYPVASWFNLFLWLVFGLVILEMVTLLDQARQNPRYLIMYLPLFYLIAANSLFSLTLHASRFTLHASRLISPIITALILLAIFTALSLTDLRIALVTPEPAYEAAFKVVRENWQPDDALLTMNTPAAGLYLERVDGFTVQEEAAQFLLNQETAPVDRWLGTPWIGTAAAFNAALNRHQRVWFVIDTIRQPVYFRGDWQAVINSQMEQVWSQANALVYRTRPDRIPLPTQPETLIKARLGDSLELVGYTLQVPGPQPEVVKPNSGQFQLKSPVAALNLTLFWRSFQPVAADYTVFLHLRNDEGTTVAQNDGLSLDGAYPSSRWQPGETIIDPFTLTLPAALAPGQYTLWAGMYQLQTLERLPVANDTSGENAVLLGVIDLQ